MQEYERKIKLKFKLLATFYDMFDIPYMIKPDSNPRLALAKKIPDDALRILDVCIGTASSSLPVAQANSQNQITGIDLSPEMLAVAENKIRKRGVRNITLMEMDATQMSFDDGEFDVAIISFALHELEYELMMAILKEVSRVVKKSGKLFIIDFAKEGSWLETSVLSIYFKIVEPKHIPQFLKYDWNELLQSMGFQVTDTEKYLFAKLISADRNAAP